MSDWLNHLAALESEATDEPWETTPNDHVKAWLEPPEMEPGHHAILNTLYGRDARLIAALRNNAPELISRARRAEELEREVGEWRDTVSGEPPTLLRRLLAVAQSHNDPLRGLLLRVWKREQQLESENHRLLRALEACRAEMERQGMDTSTPVRELHRAGRLEDA